MLLNGKKTKNQLTMKPFVKWAGGKTRLLKEIEQRLPADFDTWEDVVYVEPFVGGGSVLFHMLKKHNNISKAVINDINPVLMHAYQKIKQAPMSIMDNLVALRNEYNGISADKTRIA